MATTARLGIDITAIDKSRTAFASVNRQLTSLTTNVNTSLRAIRQFRGAFTAAFVGLGVRAAIDGLGRAVDKNLVEGAGRMQARWETAWEGFKNRGDKYIADAAMELSSLYDTATKFLGVMDQIDHQTVNRDAMGGRSIPAPGATYGKGLPNNVTDIGKTAAAIQGVNTALKENAIGYREAEKAKQEWSFDKDILGSLDEQISLLQVQVDTFGQSESAIDALIVKQQALNEAIAAGHPLNETELALLEQKIALLKQLGVLRENQRQVKGAAEEELRKSQQEAEEFKQNFKDAFSGFAQQIASGVKPLKALQSELENLSQRLLKMATDKIFDMVFGSPQTQFGPPLGIFGQFMPSFGGMFAGGGDLGAGKWGIAGEAGPELIHGPATITPMGKIGGGYGNVRVYDNSGNRVTTREKSDGFGRKDLEVIIDQRTTRNAADTNSGTSRILTARGAGPGLKKR